MKALKNFFSEDNEKEVKPTREGAGADDKKYFALMSEYKLARRGNDRDAANKILDRAMKVARDGDVSRDAKIGAAYL